MANGGSVGFSIGEVSQAIGLAPQTLRLWERERLVRPRRTDRGYRVYTEPDVERLRTIKQLRKGEGLNFAAIRKQLGPAAEEPREDGSITFSPEAISSKRTPLSHCIVGRSSPRTSGEACSRSAPKSSRIVTP